MLFSSVGHAGSFIYPSKGQSPEQQTKDETACHQWAKQQTGTDPQIMAQQSTSGKAYQQPEGGYHGVLRGGAGGAALGAVGGAIGGNAGKGAAIGAGVGAVFGLLGRRREMREQEQYNQAVTQEQNARLKEYEEAYDTCLKGGGYTVG
jgi:hypothetical protein